MFIWSCGHCVCVCVSIFVISQQITLIKNETEITRRRVVEVTEESNRLLADLDDLERRLQDLERQAEEDAALAKQVLLY